MATMRDMDEGLAELGRNVAELMLNELRIEAISTAVHHMAKRGLETLPRYRRINESLEETNRRLDAWKAKQARA